MAIDGTTRRAYVVSLNFNPGHVSHMVASYRQLSELGYESWLYVDRQLVDFIPAGCRYVVYGEERPEPCAVAFFMFPSWHNLREIVWLKRKYGSKIVYVFHEPLDKYASYRKAGFSRMKMLKLRVINQINALTVRWSDVILIPSQRAVTYYDANGLYRNAARYYLPLMYDDEWNEAVAGQRREYFSYIGTVASDHSFDRYVRFVSQAVRDDRLPDVRFLIATKNHVGRDGEMQWLLDSGRLTLIEGRPLSDEEINRYYASSLAVWNAYERTTQSGVLAKAFMFGTPAIVLRKNLSEFVENGRDVVVIDDNTSLEQICHAVEEIQSHFQQYSESCRQRFLQTFYYRNYNQVLQQIIG